MININGRRLASTISFLIAIGLNLPSFFLAIEIRTDATHRIILIQDSHDGATAAAAAFSLQIGGVPFSQTEQWRVHLSDICRERDHQEEVACQYDEILQRIKSTAMIESNRLKSSSSHGADTAAEQDYSDEIEYNTAMIDELTLLTSFHNEQLEVLSFAASTYNNHHESNDDDNFIIAKMHYDRSLGSFLACEYYQTSTWQLLLQEETMRKEDYAHLYNENNIAPSVYERHAISYGALGTTLHLSDLYHRYYASYHDNGNTYEEQRHRFFDNGNAHDPNEEELLLATKMREGYSLSYRYLLTSEYWCYESLELLNSIDFAYDTSTTKDRRERIYQQQMKQQHEQHVNATTQSCAHVHVRLGTLLLDMYADGYTLTSEEMLSYNPSAEAQTVLMEQQSSHDKQYPKHIAETIKADQERLLHSIVERFQTGIAMRNTDDEDRVDSAVTHHHLGLAHQYLGDYKSAVSEWKISLNIYREVFNEYKEGTSSTDNTVDGGMTSIHDIVTSLITVSQVCCDALLSLGHYEESIELYGLNQKLRRYLYDETSIEADLVDQDITNDNVHDEFPSLFDTESIDESINEHRLLLDDYHKNLSNNPDGSYHDVSFDIGGSQILPSQAISDKVYEGSLRSVIGSLYLAKNDFRMAKDELEQAVSLLRNGIQEEELGMWEEPAKDVDGNAMSLPLYLADALLNLSYAQSGMGQWHSSMMSFREALDIYEKESLGESPFGESNGAGESIRTSDPVQKRDSLFETLKSKFGVHIGNNGWEGVDNSTTANGSARGEL